MYIAFKVAREGKEKQASWVHAPSAYNLNLFRPTSTPGPKSEQLGLIILLLLWEWVKVKVSLLPYQLNVHRSLEKGDTSLINNIFHD